MIVTHGTRRVRVATWGATDPWCSSGSVSVTVRWTATPQGCQHSAGAGVGKP